jgi:hypothetical protein
MTRKLLPVLGISLLLVACSDVTGPGTQLASTGLDQAQTQSSDAPKDQLPQKTQRTGQRPLDQNKGPNQ